MEQGRVYKQGNTDYMLEVTEANELVEKDKSARPTGKSVDPDKTYFWKMAKDKRTIDVIIPLAEPVKKNDVVYRIGDDSEDPMRGPMIEVGFKYSDEEGKTREKLIVDGQVLNAINRRDSFWTLEEIAGVQCISVTLRRPSMMRTRDDPVLQVKKIEERIDPQTWDALLVQERERCEVTQKVFFDIACEGKPAGRVEMGLFGDDFPKTCKNFVGLVTGEYEDEDGNSQKSAFCYKGMKLDKVLKGNFIAGGNPGLDLVSIKLDQEQLEEYLAFYEDFTIQPKKVGKIEKSWTLRWGADLGLPTDPGYGKKKEGDPVDGASREELNIIRQLMRDLVKRGEGAELNFLRSEWSRGCDVTGATFGAEGFKVAHERGMVSMDRDEEKDIQGSKFFITLKEYPEMDKRWVCFGQITGGMDVLEYIEDEYEGQPRQVVIQDCGVVP